MAVMTSMYNKSGQYVYNCGSSNLGMLYLYLRVASLAFQDLFIVFQVSRSTFGPREMKSAQKGPRPR